VAAISHLPLVAAVALTESVAGVVADGETGREDWPEARSLAASGWRDMTRLARGDVAMGAGIAATNAAALATRLRDYRDRLDEWITLLEAPDGPDAGELEARLAAARARLEAQS
jgi:prephenate dehydrogenase